MSPSTTQKTPKSVILRGTSTHGPLQLEIPVQVLDEPGETLHQLAAKKAIAELEEGRGWLYSAEDDKGNLIVKKHPGRFDEIVEREAVRLGVQFQVGGKFCSFVAVEKKEKSKDTEGDEKMSEKDYEYLDGDSDAITLSGDSGRLDELVLRAEDLSSHSVSLSAQPRSYKKKKSSGFGGGLFGAVSNAFSSSPAPRPSAAPAQPKSSLTTFGSFSASQSTSGHRGSRGGFATRQQQQPQQMAPAAESFSSYGAPPPPPPGGAAPTLSRSRVSALSAVYSQRDMVEEESDGGMCFAELDEESSAVPPPAPAPARKSSKASSQTPEVEVFKSFRAAPLSKKKKSSPSASAPSKNPLQALVELQTFEGFWEWTPELCSVLGLDQATVEGKNVSGDKKVLATALAVRFFEAKLPNDKDGWEMIVEKAKGWLESVGHDEDDAIWEVVNGIIA
jgi:hypothetical protein